MLSGGQFIPAGVDVDPSIVPDHIKKQHEPSKQPKKKVPKDYQGPRYCDAQGNSITDWEEHLAAQREHLESEWARSGLRYHDMGEPERIHERHRYTPMETHTQLVDRG